MKNLQFNFIKQEVRPNSISDIKVDASFRKIAKNAICFYVWKIDEDRLEAESKPQFGTFIDDCAYIIYAASPVGTYVHQDAITREAKTGTNLERFIHFWLGANVTEQKRSNVAHKIQELDSYFGNVATEYRETQDNESARFLSYFKRGINIRSGILVTSKEKNRLYQVRGRKWLRCVEMESISWEHFSSDYIMIVKTDPHIYIWIGRSSSIAERRDAIELGSKLQSNFSEITIVDDGYEQMMPEARKSLWNSVLPLSQRTVRQCSPELADAHSSGKLKIYKCGYRGTRLHLDQLDVVIPTKDDLKDSTTTYVLDGYSQGVWLWVGSQASHQDNTSAMGNGRAFVKKKKYSYCTPVVRVVEGHEPIEFTRLFPNWHNDWNESPITFKPISTILGKFDSVTLCQRPKMAADTQLIDDGSGERKIFRITKDQAVEMPVTKAIMFATNNCYVVQYSVVVASPNPPDYQNVGIKDIVYQWNGSEATAETLSKCERFAKTCFDDLPQKAMFVQMSEFDETPHFLQIFDGKLIILQSEKNVHASNKNLQENNSKNNNNIDDATVETKQHFVLKVYGDASYNSKAIEVYPLSSMSPKECYILRTTHVWVWCGQSSTGDSREVAKNIGALLGESSLIMEGKEPKEFWSSITSHTNQPLISNCSLHNNTNGNNNNSHNHSNGSISPQNGYLTPNVSKTRPASQLFLIYTQGGKFRNQEIISYDQHDLTPENVYILDAGLICYIWLGSNITTYEKEKYLKLAQFYLETVPIARRPTTAIAVVRQNDEPNVFKGFFDSWNHELWDNYTSYEQKRQLFASLNDAPKTNGNSAQNGENGNSPLPPSLLNHQKDFDKHHKYPIVTLQQEIDLLPTEVNPLKREVHLTHDDFVALFSMSFWEYDELPVWKKQELKKKHKLF